MPKRNSVRLSDPAIAKMVKPKTREERFDAIQPGLALRITPKGNRSWCVYYRLRGRNRRLTIGRWANGSALPEGMEIPAAQTPLGVAAAREAAERIRGMAVTGTDPATVRDRATTARRIGRDATVTRLALRFVVAYSKRRKRTWKDDRAKFKRVIVPEWGDRLAREIDRDDIRALLRKVERTRGPGAANRHHALLSKWFRWAVSEGHIPTSPFVEIAKPAAERDRDRVLTDAEIKAIWNAAAAEPYPFGPFLKLLFLTAKRRTEVAAMRWADVDLDAKTWSLGRDANKTGRAEIVPLSNEAADLIAGLPRVGHHVFTTNARTPISGFSVAKRRIEMAAARITLFDRLDGDGDGLVTLRDIRKAAPDAPGIDERFAALDQDGDGRITRDEFRAAEDDLAGC